VKFEKTSVNAIDAICTGAADGMKLVLNVVAMLLAFVSVVAMINWGFGKIHAGLSLQSMLGWVFAPIAWVMGVPWNDCPAVGGLLGTRMILNEFIAYMELMKTEVSARAYVVSIYALCGFANLGSVAIQIGGISTIAPSRRADLARLGMRAMLAGTLATFLTASIAGALISDEEAERDYRKNKARVAATAADKVEQYDTFLRKYPNSSFAQEIRALRAGVK
jgi:CNT family concentrative nucleoside transporter